MSHGPAQLQTPRDPRLMDAWRAAAKAFRLAYGVPALSYDEKLARADAALREAVPELSGREAMLETIAAIHYASVVAPDWLYALHQPAPRQR